MSILGFFIHRKTFVGMVFLGLSLLGYISYRQLRMELIPDVEQPFLIINITAKRDTNPEYMEKQALIPLEGAAAALEGVSEIESYAEPRRGIIYLYFDKNVNINYAYIKLQEKVSGQIPALSDEFNVRVVKVDTERFSNMFMNLQVRGSGGLERIRAVIDRTILRELENIDGVSHVEVTGGRVKSVEIVLDEQASKAYGVTPAEIRSLINRNAARKAFVGYAYGNGRRYFVNLEADYVDVRNIENIVVDEKGPVFLKDVASVTFGTKEETSISRVNGKDAVTLRLIRDANVNLIELSHTTREVIDGLNARLKPQDIEIVIQSDAAREMEKNIDLIKELAVTGGLLAMLILWFFLRNLRLVLIVLVAVPVSILTSFNFFYAFDITLNSLTLVGMALAVGMLLDNSVVVLENIYRHLSLGEDRDPAVIRGTGEVWRSIVAATLTTITVFLPFAFSSENLIRVIGRHIGVSIISTLLVSLLVALVLIPAATHSMLGAREKHDLLFSKVSFRNRMVQIYTLFLKSAIRFPAWTVIGTVVLFFASVILCMTFNLDVARELDLREFNLYVTMPKGSTLERTDAVTADLEAELDGIEEIQDIVSTIYEEEAAVTVILKEDFESIAGRSIAEIKSDIQQRIDRFGAADVSMQEPRASRRFGRGGFNPAARLERLFGIGPQQEKIIVKGNDYELIKAVAEDIEFNLGDLDSVERTNLSTPGDNPEIHLLFDKTLMSRNEIPLSSVAAELSSFDREVSTDMTFKQGTDEYEITIRNENAGKSVKTVEDLRKLEIPTPSGASHELGDISRIIRSHGISRISRINQEKRVELNYSFHPEVNDSKAYLESSRAEVDELVAAVNLPPGVSVEIVHDESDLSEFYFLIGAAFILIYMILASVFESLVTPVVMMFTIPLATIGSFWAIILTGNSLKNANSMMGFLILLGVVVNNGIILIDYTRILRRRGFRMSRALMTAGRARVRPILITAVTTIVAMTPLAMGKAEYVTRIGAPFAITVIGGLSLSTVFTLVLIPTIYSSLERTLEWLKGLHWRIKLLQASAFVASCVLIYTYIDSPLWMGGYLFLAVTGIPAVTWFVMTSLRRAQAEYIPPGEELTIVVRRLVKIYDGYGRFTREWRKGERYERILGEGRPYSRLRDFEPLRWQVPLLGFLVYFVYFYLDSAVWLFILSHAVYFFGLTILRPFRMFLAYRARETGKPLFRRLSSLLHNLFLWGFPLFSLVLFRTRNFRYGMLAFIALVWFSALTVFLASGRIHARRINIMRLTGRFAGLRRLFYRYVTMIPVIGKRKSPFNALDGVSLTIRSGMFGLLGPNGAGKTTLMRMICGILEKNMGKITINGIDFTEKREELQGLIGYLPQEFGTYENMTAYEFLDYLAILKGLYDRKKRAERVEYVLSSVHLNEQRNRKIGTFSGGMKQRIGIALTLLHLPRILVVDEPTAGLDPRERIRFRNLLVELSNDRIVIFSTHIIEDISSSCNRVAVLNEGKLYYLGDPQEMTETAKGKVWQFDIDEGEFEETRAGVRLVHHMRTGRGIRIRCLSETEPHPGARKVQPTLEDAYLWLLGKSH